MTIEGRSDRGKRLPPDSDAAWLAGLSGKAMGSTEQDPSARREGSLLREALLQWAPEPDPVAAEDRARADRLVARARAAGLLPEAPAPRPRSPLESLRDWWSSGSSGMGRRPTFAMALAVLVVVGAVFVGRSDLPLGGDEAVERASPDGIVVLRAADPAGLRRELVAALARDGVVAKTYERLGRLGIDAELPAMPDASLRKTLKTYRLPVPDDSVLKVEIGSASP